jgi:hypothetical protein
LTRDEQQSQISIASSNFQTAAKSFLGGSVFGMKGLVGSENSLLASSESTSQKNVAPREISPTFLQFLDCMYQIWTQFPTKFEFDEKLLVFLVTHVYSCKFGNFLFNNERERSLFQYQQKKIEDCTADIWRFILNDRESFVNPLYHSNASSTVLGEGTGRTDAAGKPGTLSMDGKVLCPSSINLKLWNFYLKREVYFDQKNEIGINMESF